MRKRRETASAASEGSSSGSDASEKKSTTTTTNGAEARTTVHVGNSRRSPFVWLALFLIITYCCLAIYNYQFQNMPVPLTAEQAGKRGFSETEAFKHVKALTEVGPHPVGSEALNQALQVGFSTLLVFPSYNSFVAFFVTPSCFFYVDLDKISELIKCIDVLAFN